MDSNSREESLRDLQRQADAALAAMTKAAAQAKKAQGELAGGLSPDADNDFVKATDDWKAAVRSYDQAQAAMEEIRRS